MNQESGQGDSKTVKISVKDLMKQIKNSPYLVITAGRGNEMIVPMAEKPLTIGRSPEADIVIDDPELSRIHCSISCKSRIIYLEDHQSTNGVFVNGEQFTGRGTVVFGSFIQLGRNIIHAELLSKEDVEFRTHFQRRANYDPLTGAYNRFFFMEALHNEVTLSHREASPLRLVMFDLDHFKIINDTHGHPAGDYILQEFTKLIFENIREHDLLCRYGGEEFLLLLKGDLDFEGVELISERIRSVIETHKFIYEGQVIPVTTSIGACYISESTDYSVDDLLANTDRALYSSKENGRNRISLASDAK